MHNVTASNLAAPTSRGGHHPRTPPSGRDTVIDAARVVAVLTVAIGHALVAAVEWRNGGFEAEHVLGATPWTQWLTYGFQVMPIVFFCGGVANAASLARAERFGPWLGSRIERLAGPTFTYAALAAAALAVGAGLGLSPATVVVAGHALTMHLWFLAAYAVVLTATPLAAAAQHRWGLRAAFTLFACAAAVDAVARLTGEPSLAWCNLVFVWGGAHQLGVAWQAGALRLPARFGLAIAAAGAGLIAVLIGALGYPLSMVSVPGMGVTNAGPPSLAMVGLATVQVGMLIAGRRRLAARTTRPATAARVASLNAAAMGIYLWHFAAMTIAAVLLLPAGIVPDHQTGSAAWWLARPLWIGGCALVLVALLPLARRLGRRRTIAADVSGARAVVAAVLAAAGFLVLTLGGVAPTSMPLSLPLPALALLAAALVVLGAGGSRRPRASEAQPASAAPGPPAQPPGCRSPRSWNGRRR